MEEESGSSLGKKKPLTLEGMWGTVRNMVGEDKREVTLGTQQQQGGKGGDFDVIKVDDLKNWPDYKIEEKKTRLLRSLDNLAPKLPDQGRKLRVYFDFLEDEQRRRREQAALLKERSYSNEQHSQTQCLSRNESDEGYLPISSSCNRIESDNDRPTPSQAFLEDFCVLRPKKLERKLSSLSKLKVGKPCFTSKSSFSCFNWSSDQKGGSKASNCSNPDASIRRSTRLQNTRHKIKREAESVILSDEDDPQSGRSVSFEKEDRRRGTKIYYPPREPAAVMISYSDLKCLAPSSYISSPIMNFYIQYIQVEQSHDKRVGYHIFNTYFYSKLDEALSLTGDHKEESFMKLRRWWKGINIFEKSYILLPVHYDCHWSLGIICFPLKESDQGPTVFHLDSLGTHPSNSIYKNIRSYLEEEWKYLKDEMSLPDLPFSFGVWNNLLSRTRLKKIEVLYSDLNVL